MNVYVISSYFYNMYSSFNTFLGSRNTLTPAESFVGGGKPKKGPPHSQKAPHMVKRALYKEKNVAKKTLILRKSSKKASHIAKRIAFDFSGEGGGATAYFCPPPPAGAHTFKSPG